MHFNKTIKLKPSPAPTKCLMQVVLFKHLKQLIGEEGLFLFFINPRKD